MQALLAARQREDTDAFKDTYRHRAGTLWDSFTGGTRDGITTLTLSGLAQTHLAHVAIATAMYLVQLAQWQSAGCAGTNSHFCLQAGHAGGGMSWG